MDFAERLYDWLDDLTVVTGVKLVADPLTHPPPADDAVTLRMPGYRQTDSFSCGFVAGLMAVHALHPRRSVGRFYDLVSPHRVTGTSNARLVQALRASGVVVTARKDLDFHGVAAAIHAGAPVVTTIATGCADTWHWVTLYGVGERPRRVFLAGSGTPGWSRARREHEMLWGEFAGIWRPRGFGLVCRRR